jgi:hypothetical protein
VLVLSAQLECEAGLQSASGQNKVASCKYPIFPSNNFIYRQGRSCGAGNDAAARGGRAQGVAKLEENVHFKLKKKINFLPSTSF